MRKLFSFCLLVTLTCASLRAQTGGFIFSGGYSFGFIKSESFASRGFSTRMFSSGPSFGIDIIKGIAVSFRYDSYNASDKYPLNNGGFRRLNIKQHLGKFMVGFGMCDPEKGMFAVQFGFTIGNEFALLSREYPDGTISHGMDYAGNGGYESFRAMPPLLAVRGGIAVADGLILFGHLEHGFKKGFGESPFTDFHAQKDFAFGVGSGGSNPYGEIQNDITSWRFEIGLKYALGI